MKKVIYPALLIILSSLTFYSCSSSDEPDPNIEGKWKIVERSLVCEYEDYGEDITNRFLRAKENGDVYNLTFGEGAYLEQSFVNTDGELVGDRYLNGTYTMSADKRIMSVVLPTSRGSWIFNTRLVDQNNDFFFFEQEITSNDVENIYLVYFGVVRHLDEGITGVLRTKAVRIKE